MEKFISVDKLVSSIEESKIKNKSTIIKIINEQPYKIIIDEEDDNIEDTISCSECIYHPDKAPCLYCEGYSNFIEIPF